MSEWMQCIRCSREYETGAIRYECECGGLLSVERDRAGIDRSLFDLRRAGTSLTPGTSPAGREEPLSGVWRFREAVLDVPLKAIITHPEGATRLYEREGILFKHEGENPTGSFKDRGMTVAVTQAMRLGAGAVACASTGNTSASLAAYAAQAGLKAIVFVPAGKISKGKLAQSLAYGARCVQLQGDFDVAMRFVREVCHETGIYLVNSINPFRIEGQKTIVWELLQDLGWQPPDWIVVPAGNLGNTSAFGKALREAKDAGWIDRVPRIASIQAAGANPFARGFREGFASRHRVDADTVASAVRIGDPVSWERAVAAIRETDGVVEDVTDGELMAGKREIDRWGIGCEPASGCTLAGMRKLRDNGTIAAGETVACVLTGHILKDSEANLETVDQGQVIEIEPSVAAFRAAVRGFGV